ncbi:RNA polymerase sigma factor [Longimicrobium sp.]|uniref:RNA polymerase sigma factor n=1 Tax=Longimicrobium sp. TaxID=2029185 RepID=UPI003B3B2079
MHQDEADSAVEIVGLLRAAAADARDAGARRLVANYGDRLFGYLINTVGLEELDAADVLNDALYRAILRIDQLKRPENLAGWLYKLAYRAGVDWHRKLRARHEVPLEREPLLVAPGESSDQEPGSEVVARAERVDAALETLSPRDREVLSAVAHDLTNEEIAEVLGVTPGHARVLRHRASERFRKAYARVGGGDGRAEAIETREATNDASGS